MTKQVPKSQWSGTVCIFNINYNVQELYKSEYNLLCECNVKCRLQ
jgi:hypothetical protein